jgi:hypothetical protein
MGLKVAIASGNWSNPAIWEGGTLPTAIDIVAANGFIVNIDQSITVECLTNIAHPANSVPFMRNLTVPSGLVTASGSYDQSLYLPFRAFDGNTSTAWLTLSGFTFGWLAYEFKTAKIITRYKVIAWTIDFPSMPRNWTFEAWNGSAWIVLHTVTNNSLSSYTGTITNTTAYKQYRINVTTNNGNTIYSGISEFVLDNVGDRETPSTAGGSFTVVSGIVITCTQAGLYSGLPLITISSAGTYNFVSNLAKTATNSVLTITGGSQTVNIVGNLMATDGGLVITANVQYTLNITGNLTSFEAGGTCLSIVNATICNITGNIIGETLGGSQSAVISISGAICNITGNVFYTQRALGPLILSYGVLSIVGIINATGTNNSGANAVYNEYNSNAVNLLSGPFIFSITSVNPVMVSRIHLIPVSNSYVEFRDSSTNGALPPAVQSPATRLVSPDTVADAPSPNNVRQGVSYSSGALTGTMIVPSPDNVSKNIPVDNTVGTAVLDATAIWAVPLTSINTSNSIGRRVKNAATVETTGAQIQTTLNNNE